VVNLLGTSVQEIGRMDQRTSPAPEVDTETDHTLERRRRASLEIRHAQRLARLMVERSDLRGVHALADLVDDAVRWSA